MLYLILLPVLVSLCLIPLFGERRIKSSTIAIAGSFVSLVLSLYYLFTYFGKSVVESYSWFLGGFSLSFIGDNLTLSFAVLVSFISLIVLIFSVFYMKKEPQERYYTEMSIFILAMLGLVLSNSLLLFYIFWELVGVSSYLLIGFWYKKESASAAGKKALVMTRIGDMAFFAALVILFIGLGTFSIPSINAAATSLSQPLLLLSGSLILIAALSKSAQFPFYTWLPDAMEGPTPVSALLHSATMVAAGAYLIIVMSPLLTAAGLNMVLIAIGLLTAFIATFLALNHRHIKRILAYSTIESLAFMFIAVGTANTGGAVFYLFAHAFFKSLLFLMSGVFAVLLGVQDIYALKLKKLANTWIAIPALIGIISLAGLPPFMSFFAHLSLAAGFNVYENLLFVALSFLTALFAFRMFFLVFNQKAEEKLEIQKESAIPMYLLSAISVVGGLLMFSFTNIVASFTYILDIFTLIDVLAALLGVFVAFEFFYRSKYQIFSMKAKNLAIYLSRHSYDSILAAAGRSVARIGYLVGLFDSKLSIFYDKLADGSLFLSSKSRRIEDGDTQTYIFAIMIGIIAILAVASIYI